MAVYVYPSRLEGEPLETHETTERLSIAEWMLSVAPDFRLDAVELHPTIRLNGDIVEPPEWPLTFFGADDRVDVYIEAKGTVAIIAAVVLSVVAIAMVMSMKANTPQDRRRGTNIEDPGALANQVRWGDPIPEIAGAPRTYPDYIMPPRRYFVNRTEQWVDSLVCIGRGSYLKDLTQVFIGETPATSLGDDLEVRFFEPGEDIPSPYRDWWHTPDEVGFTSLGGAGMTLGPAVDISSAWTDTISITGTIITGDVPVPESWEPGLFVRVDAEHPLTFSGNTVQSALLDTLGLTTGDEIELTGERAGIYTLSSIFPGTGGSPGSPATATGSAAPTRLDFGVTHAALTITLAGSPYTVTLTTDAANLTDLVAGINSQLNGTQVRAREAGAALELYQIEPYTGGTLSLSGDVADLMGTPALTAGTPASAAQGARYAVAGADFGSGVEVAAAGRDGMLYEIVSISSSTITVTPPGIAFWPGFPADVSDATSSVAIDQGSLEGGWVGPFNATPEGEQSDAFEVDIAYPGGLIYYNKKGRIRAASASGFIHWRHVGESEWNSVPFSNTQSTPDHIGFTYRVDHDPGRVEVRVRSTTAPSSSASVSDKQQWVGLRSHIIGAPVSYPGMTVAHVRMRSGDKVSGAVENKMSIRAMRILPTVEDPDVMEPTRDIAPFFIHMMDTVGYGRDLIDMEHITALHQIWRDRGDTFDLSANGTSTLKTVANYCLNAGFAELTLRRGWISAARDAYRMGSPPRVYSPQELVSPLVESTESVMPDDIDGVDIEYVDYLTGRTLTEQYRLIGDQGRRVEKIQSPGVTGRTQAWRLAARRRRMAAYRRTVYKGSTELAAMNSYYMDYVGLQDGIPEWGQSAFVIDHDGAVLTLSEDVARLDGYIIARIRNPDGTASRPVPVIRAVGREVELASIPDGVVVGNDPNAPTVVYIGLRTQVVHEALMTEVRPSGESRVEFQAVRYDERVYAEDDRDPFNEVALTTRVYEAHDYTSTLYPLEFDDSLAPSAAAPSVSWGIPPMDAMTVSMVAPAVYRRVPGRYKAEPEAIGVAMLAPSVYRRSTARVYSFTEALGVAMLPPVVSRRNQPAYTIPEESLAIAMLAPTVTRTNT